MPTISIAEARSRFFELVSRASALGQEANLLTQIEEGEVQAVMLAFGLWQDEPHLEDLEIDVYTNRQQQPERPNLDL